LGRKTRKVDLYLYIYREDARSLVAVCLFIFSPDLSMLFSIQKKWNDKREQQVYDEKEGTHLTPKQ